MIRSLPQYILVLIVVGLAAANTLVWRAALAPRALTVSVFETEKGNAIFVTTPSGRTLLIDSNSDASILRALGNTIPFWTRSLDVVISLKSGAGLAEIKNRYRVTQMLSSLTRGQRLNFYDGTFLDVLWPPPKVAEAPVLLLSYGSTSFLIEPIISPHTEKYLASVDTSLPPSSFIISSSTPVGASISNGDVIKNH